MQTLMVKTSLYWEVDSAALRTWNIGRRPHKHCLKVLREHGLRSDHFCRLVMQKEIIVQLNDSLFAFLSMAANCAGLLLL